MFLAEVLITPSEVYWVTRLDSLRTTVATFGFAASVVVFISVFVHYCALADGEARVAKQTKRVAILSALAALPLLTARPFLPSTRDMVLILGLPAIVNNEKVQEKAANALDGTEDILRLAKLYVEKELKGGGKEGE